jgi:RNA polymerase sigma-70 factor (ECF subfamily)
MSPEELIRVCVQTGEEAAWTEFVRRFQPVIANVVLRVSRRWDEVSPQLVDDLIQETYLKLCADSCALLKRFEPSHEGAIFGYIQVVTANLVQDHFRAAVSQKRGGGKGTTSLDSGTPESSCLSQGLKDERAERAVFIREIDSILRSLEESAQGLRDRRIFWLYYRVGLSASAIAALPAIGLSTKGVESTLLRLTRHVRDCMATKSTLEQGPNVRTAKGIQPTESL